MFTSDPYKQNHYIMKLSFNERKNLLLKEFESFPFDRNRCTEDEIYKFLDDKVSKSYDCSQATNIILRIRENSKKLTIDNFIDEFLNVEDSLSFQIQLDKDSIDELKKKKEIILTKKEEETNNLSDNLKNNSIFIIHILEANNLLSTELINPFIKIKFGFIQMKTLAISNLKNPVWNEVFKIPILKEDEISEIIIILTDQEKDQKDDFYGYCIIEINDLKDQISKDKDEFLISKDGYKTNVRIHFAIQYIFSKIKIYENQIKLIDNEIVAIIKKINLNDKKLQILLMPFKSIKNDAGSANSFYQIITSQRESYNQSSINKYHLEIQINDSVKGTGLAVHKQEEHYTDKIDDFFKKKGVTSWAKIFTFSNLIFMILLSLISFMKSSFYDLMILFGITIAIYSPEIGLKQIHLRSAVLLELFSVGIDISWLVIFVDNWSDSYDSSMSVLKLFVIIMSFIVLFYKVFFLGLLWRCSVKFQDFSDNIKLYIK